MISYGFISTFDLDKIEYELERSSLIKRGKELLERERQENSKLTTKEKRINAKIDLGVISGSLEVIKNSINSQQAGL